MQTLSPISITVPPRGRIEKVRWQRQSPRPHEFEAIAIPEEEGGFSIFAAHYPGVISQGENLDEAKANIAEAFIAVLESRQKHGEKMTFSSCPWMDAPPASKRLRITVDV